MSCETPSLSSTPGKNLGSLTTNLSALALVESCRKSSIDQSLVRLLHPGINRVSRGSFFPDRNRRWPSRKLKRILVFEAPGYAIVFLFNTRPGAFKTELVPDAWTFSGLERNVYADWKEDTLFQALVEKDTETRVHVRCPPVRR